MSQTRLSWQLSTKNVRYAAAAFAMIVTVALLFHIGRTSGRQRSIIYAGQTDGTSAARQKSLEPIQNSTLGFEAILAINLPERTDHRDGLVLASAVTDLRVKFIDGVHGKDILDKVLPPKHIDGFSDAVKGSWRAHINAIRTVVENRWSSALIIEDDVDWDIRLRTQLHEFALASNYVLKNSEQGTVSMKDIVTHVIPQASLYGDGWDVLWLGHCGMELPKKTESTVVLIDDETAPEAQYQKSWDENAQPPMIRFPNHTRAVMEPHGSTCTLAYAVSQKGAQQILLSLGLRRLDAAFDLMLRDWCQGSNGHEKHNCVSVLPQLFDHHRRIGPNEIDSDISAPNDKTREKAYTNNIRWSVRLNMDQLLKGDTNYVDQYPDTS